VKDLGRLMLGISSAARQLGTTVSCTSLWLGKTTLVSKCGEVWDGMVRRGVGVDSGAGGSVG